MSLGVVCRPNSLEQYWTWVQNILPQAPSMHTVSLAAVVWAIWRTRNNVCFNKKKMRSPSEIVCLICSFLAYWTGLFKEDLKEQVIQGAEVVKSTALFFHNQDMQARAHDDLQMLPFAG